MRRKRKLKKVVRILLWVVLFCFLISFATILILNLPKEEKNEKETINYTNEIMKLENHSFDRKFLLWVEDNYGEGILSELFGYLKDDSYDIFIENGLIDKASEYIKNVYKNKKGRIFLLRKQVTVCLQNRSQKTFLAEKSIVYKEEFVCPCFFCHLGYTDVAIYFCNTRFIVDGQKSFLHLFSENTHNSLFLVSFRIFCV